jgi:hypothetical protein
MLWLGQTRTLLILAARRKNEMSKEARPTDREIEAAARILYEEGCLLHWWPVNAKSYDEFAALDPIGLSEFGGIAERILIAASEAKPNTQMP